MVLDFNTIIQAVSTIGFPTAICVYFLLYISKELRELKDSITKLDMYMRTKFEHFGGDK